MDTQLNMELAATLPFLKLSAALLIGIIIGWEREQRENVPGMRLLPLVCVGATLFTFYAGVDANGQLINPALAGGVVTGVGFLGAGMISREFGALTGVTTAATIWVTAALGIGLGLGYFLQVFVVTGAVLVILWFFPYFTRSSNHNLLYEIIAPFSEARYDELDGKFVENKLEVVRHSLSRNGDQMTCVWFANGDSESHQRLARILVNEPDITDFNTRLGG